MRPELGCAQRFVFLAVCVALSAGSLLAQETPSTSEPMHIGLPVDWSSQHIIYTRNGSVEDMMRVRSDPRFLHSFLIHNAREHIVGLDATSGGGVQQANDADAEPQRALPVGLEPPQRPRRGTGRSRADWAMSLGAGGMAIGESPAMYTFDPTAKPTCTTSSANIGDWVVFSLRLPGGTSAGQANLLALTNLYSGSSPTGLCGAAPTWLFSYHIGSGGSLLSPVLSYPDGKKVAWIENTTGGGAHAVLHVTTWKYGEGTDATHPSAIGNCASGNSCDVPLSYTTLGGCGAPSGINTNSEIYVDYPSDVAFVGADNSYLYHISGIFKGTPTVDACIQVNTTPGIAISGGVYDPLLSPPEFFISDSKKLYAYTYSAGAFTLVTSYTYGQGTLTGPGPILDAFNNFIYAFSANDLAGHTSVTQIKTSLLGSTASVVPLGPASTNSWPVLFYGAYDNNYFNNGPANSLSTLYSCGTDATTTTAQDLFAISFNSTTGVMNTTPRMSANKNVNPGGLNGTCSPITEYYDGGTDRLFIGMGQHTATSGANVVSMWDVTTPLSNSTTTPTAVTTNSSPATTYWGGSSGIIADNNASSVLFPQAHSIYFTTLATSGTNTPCGANNYCAVKLTQGGLQ